MKVAVVGAGFQGRLHVEYLSALDDVEVVAVCDPDAARADEVAAAFGIDRVYSDYRRALDAHDLDLVTVCTMPVLHRQVTVDALDAGAHVLCEKPLAMNAAEGREMLDAAQAAGRLLTVGFNLRHTRSAQILKRFVNRSGFGDPVYTRAWGKASQIPWWGQHYRRDISGGGALAATAVHLVDLALWLAGHPTPTTVSASMRRLFPTKRGQTAPDDEAAASFDAEDLLSAHVRFDNGFWMTVEASWIDNKPSVDGAPSWDYSFDAIGERAQLQFDPLVIAVEDEDGEIVSAVDPEDVPGVSFPDSLAALIRDVVDSIRSSRPPVVRAEEALVVQSIVDAIYASAAVDREVTVDLPPKGIDAVGPTRSPMPD
ncbi:Gfo/Idh/MocA family oxidoreductase [soil metagenome]